MTYRREQGDEYPIVDLLRLADCTTWEGTLAEHLWVLETLLPGSAPDGMSLRGVVVLYVAKNGQGMVGRFDDECFSVSPLTSSTGRENIFAARILVQWGDIDEDRLPEVSGWTLDLEDIAAELCGNVDDGPRSLVTVGAGVPGAHRDVVATACVLLRVMEVMEQPHLLDPEVALARRNLLGDVIATAKSDHVKANVAEAALDHALHLRDGSEEGPLTRDRAHTPPTRPPLSTQRRYWSRRPKKESRVADAPAYSSEEVLVGDSWLLRATGEPVTVRHIAEHHCLPASLPYRRPRLRFDEDLLERCRCFYERGQGFWQYYTLGPRLMEVRLELWREFAAEYDKTAHIVGGQVPPPDHIPPGQRLGRLLVLLGVSGAAELYGRTGGFAMFPPYPGDMVRWAGVPPEFLPHLMALNRGALVAAVARFAFAGPLHGINGLEAIEEVTRWGEANWRGLRHEQREAWGPMMVPIYNRLGLRLEDLSLAEVELVKQVFPWTSTDPRAQRQTLKLRRAAATLLRLLKAQVVAWESRQVDLPVKAFKGKSPALGHNIPGVSINTGNARLVKPLVAAGVLRRVAEASWWRHESAAYLFEKVDLEGEPVPSTDLERLLEEF